MFGCVLAEHGHSERSFHSLCSSSSLPMSETCRSFTGEGLGEKPQAGAPARDAICPLPLSRFPGWSLWKNGRSIRSQPGAWGRPGEETSWTTVSSAAPWRMQLSQEPWSPQLLSQPLSLGPLAMPDCQPAWGSPLHQTSPGHLSVCHGPTETPLLGALMPVEAP